MSLFEYSDYRAYLKNLISGLPKGGRGELAKIAHALRIHTSLLSQIMSGSREFSMEQALALSSYLGHGELESEYFLLLVQRDRAGNADLRNYLEKKRSGIKQEALKLSKRISHQTMLSEQDQMRFYSNWAYSAIHLFTSTREKGVTLAEVMQRFQIKKSRAVEILRFLMERGLVLESNGHYRMGVQSTFVEKTSPLILRHHTNWRLKALQRMETLSDSELCYTGQFSLSKKDFEILREMLATFLKNANQIVKDSPAEDIACLNLDWFWIEN